MTLSDRGYVNALSELLFSETMQAGVLAEMAEATTNPNLAMMFNRHREETRTQSQRLRDVLNRLNEGAQPAQPTEPALQSLIDEARTALDYPEPTPEKDHMLLGISRRMEQQAVLLYQAALEMAERAGDAAAADALSASLNEAMSADAQLARLERDTMPKQPGQDAVEAK